MFKPYPINSLNGVASRWPAEKLPAGFCQVGRNVRFVAGGVRSRFGLTSAFVGPDPTKAITGLGQFWTLSDNLHVPMAFDSGGNLFKESISGSGGVQSIASGLGNGLYMEGETMQNRFYMAFSDLQHPGAAPLIYHRALGDNQFYLDPVGLVPNNVGIASGNSTDNTGDVDIGDRYIVVVFETRSGYVGGMTDASVVKVSVTQSGRTLLINGVPRGPANAVARWIGIGQAGGSSAGPFFVIEEADTLEELNNPAITASIIPNNVDTTVELNFTDDYLVTTLDITNYFNKIALPNETSVYFSKSLRRLVWSGEDTSIFRVSEPDDPETYFANTGFVTPGEGDDRGRPITAREWRGDLYLIKERSGFLVANTNGDPSSWFVPQKWEGAGPVGPRGVDVCDDFMAIAGPQGFYTWDGYSFNWKSMEISGGGRDNELPNWDRVNWGYGHLVYVFIDIVNKEVRIGVPVDGATSISHEFVVSYADGWSNRKWSVNELQFTTVKWLFRASGAAPFGASANPDGAVNQIDVTATSDNGHGFWSEVITRFEPPPQFGIIHQLGGIDVMAMGAGQMTVDVLKSRTQVKSTRTIDLDPSKFTDHGLKPRGQNERFAFRFTNNGDAGSWFHIQRIVAYFNPIWQRRTF